MTDNKILKRGLRLLYPRRCPICQEAVAGERLICPECEKKVLPIGEPKCKKCGKPLELMEREFCRDCQRGDHDFDEGRGIFLYDRVMRNSILRYKDRGQREYGEFYAKAISFYCGDLIRFWDPQGVIPIPISMKKRRQRGFNQAEDLAVHLCGELNLDLYPDLLCKKKDTVAQKKLDAFQRRHNLQQIFEGQEGDWGLGRILLVDDVYTTGSTMVTASREARKHGVKEVCLRVVCIGRGF